MTIKLRLVKLESLREANPVPEPGGALQKLQKRLAGLRERLGDEYLPNPSHAEVMAGANCSDEARERTRKFMQDRGYTSGQVSVVAGHRFPDS